MTRSIKIRTQTRSDGTVQRIITVKARGPFGTITRTRRIQLSPRDSSATSVKSAVQTAISKSVQTENH